MRLIIQDNGYIQQSDLLKRTIAERIELGASDREMNIMLCVDNTIGAAESFVIESLDDVWKIIGADGLGLYYGIGKFLHTAKWSEEDFIPNPPVGVSTPAHYFRAIYTSIHFHNWYHEASTEELKKYLEELLLWGYNTIISILPLVNLHSFEEPAFYESVEKSRALFRLAKDLGMKVGMIMSPNQGLVTTPDAFEADLSIFEYRGGSSGKNICPHKDGALEYLRNIWVTTLEQFEDIGMDYVLSWPYDEGGCGCEKCRPWGAKGYCDFSTELFKEVKRFYPTSKLILSTWYFDHPINEGEYEGIWQRLKGDMSYVDYLMVDAHGAFPEYPLKHEIIKPMVNFPEISMWGVMPWGGRGANPLPKRFQEFWDSSKQVLSGGMPYSEGLYEDISKIQCVSYYWTPDRHYCDILAEYINYEYSDDVVDEVLEMMELIEENHVRVANDKQPNAEMYNRAEEIARSVNERLNSRAKNAWRWRLLYIRAIIDKVIYQYHVDHDYGRTVEGMQSEMKVKRYGQETILKDHEVTLHVLRKTKEWYLSESEEAMQLVEELCDLYHTNRVLGHMATYPPVQGREAALAGRTFGAI